MENKLRKLVEDYQQFGITLENRVSIYFCSDNKIAVSYAGIEETGDTLEIAINKLIESLKDDDYFQELLETEKKIDREFHRGL